MKTRMLPAVLCLSIAAGSGIALAEDATFDVSFMTPETAMTVAKVSLETCRGKGYQVAVVVVDRMGVPQAMIRDRFAGAHTPDTAFRKAWTAVSFREDTVALAKNTGTGTPQAGARQITNALMLGGGVPIEAGGSIVGGVGISGAPSGEADDECGRAGIAAVSADLEF
jgi:uncharacterized protein GlcG (DUF336 family)